MTPAPPAPPNAPTEDPDGLIFQWHRRSWSRLRLVPMLFFSLLAHAASFYVLQVAYTPTASQLPPPAQVVLLALDQPENASLARWLALSDPALMSRPGTPSASQTLAALDFHYVPSFSAALPAFKPLDPSGADNATVSRPPRPRAAGPIPASLLPALPLAPTGQRQLPAGQATRAVFSGDLAACAPATLPPVRFAAGKEALPLDPTVFLVGVRSSGGTPLIFRQPALFREAASADAEAEEHARQYLAGLSFHVPPSPTGEDVVVWGWATFYWGNEVTRRAETR